VQPHRLLTRGEVWHADLDPVVGYEQGGHRPVIIVSTNQFNLNASRLLFVVPITRVRRNNPLHVAIAPPEGGLRLQSYALCDMMRSISANRLNHFMGRIDSQTVNVILDRLSIVLGI
jgi:mRNA interferase MazF